MSDRNSASSETDAKSGATSAPAPTQRRRLLNPLWRMRARRAVRRLSRERRRVFGRHMKALRGPCPVCERLFPPHCLLPARSVALALSAETGWPAKSYTALACPSCEVKFHGDARSGFRPARYAPWLP